MSKQQQQQQQPVTQTQSKPAGAATLLTMSADEILGQVQQAAFNGANNAVMNLATSPQAASQFMATYRETKKAETPFWASDGVKIGATVVAGGLLVTGGVIAYNKLCKVEKLSLQTANVITAMGPSVAEDGSIVCSNLKLSSES